MCGRRRRQQRQQRQHDAGKGRQAGGRAWKNIPEEKKSSKSYFEFPFLLKLKNINDTITVP